MKIRIKGNSLRYRLTKSDMAVLSTNGYLEERIEFAGNALIYAISRDNGSRIKAEYKDHTIILSIPKLMVSELNDSDKVGFEDKSGPVYLLIEKDFTCLDTVDEDQSDNYPNPLANKTNEQTY